MTTCLTCGLTRDPDDVDWLWTHHLATGHDPTQALPAARLTGVGAVRDDEPHPSTEDTA